MAKKKSSKLSDLKPSPAEPEVAAAPETEIPQAAIADPIGDETGGEAKAALGPEIEARSEIEIEAEDGPEPESSPDHEAEAGPEPSEAEAEPEFKPKSGAPASAAADSSAGWKPRPPAKLERLQKILAKAGVASRRKAEELIEQGRVQVNGTVVTELGTKADASRDHIRVDGKLLQGPERLRYFVLNKPRGFVTTVKDPEGRPTVMQFFDKMRERLYPVGRLDYLSEGLLLVTNDGELAHRLTRAGSGVEKTYLVKVAGQPSEAELDLLRGGVAIERGKPGSPQVRTAAARVRQVRQGDNPWYEVVLIEGRNRELRKMFEAIGHFVEKIRRVGYGPLVLDQEPGSLRELDAEELAALRRVAEGKLHTPKAKEVRRRNMVDAGKLPTVAPHTAGSRPAKPLAAKSFEKRPAAGPGEYRPKKFFAQGAGADRPARPSGRDSGSARPTGRPAARPAWQRDDRPSRPPARFAARSAAEDRPAAGKPYGGRPAWSKQAPPDRTFSKRPPAPRRGGKGFEDEGAQKPARLPIEAVQREERRNRPGAPRTYSGRPKSSRPSTDGPGSNWPASERPFRGEAGLARPFTTSSGKPRAGGARPGSKPGWKPKPSYGGPGRPASGARFKPRPGSSPRSGYKGKPSGPKRGGAPGGRKRG
jgi:23S rRNA pseudouridine2605 synthase